MNYEQDPDYDFLRGLFKTIMTNFRLDNDFKFDWIKTYDKNYNSSATLHPNNIVLNNLQPNNNVCIYLSRKMNLIIYPSRKTI